ncbi:hypothetical protein [Paenibacillus agilis]|uniref:Uncharacterized protein n=1 Tax=Paenibacillus agilis TaxID=3020863 RepID=A0A559IZF5_9BACL|nr:hypothetical protein [Paenibacillus agilis]TVX93009.1 hypothetical protein FPZ44_08030 [Paenibacillus agilis]
MTEIKKGSSTQEIAESSEEVLLVAQRWAIERLQSKEALNKEETMLLERIVSSSAQVVQRYHFSEF